MTTTNVQPAWNVGRAAGNCAACGTALAPNLECWAALCDRPPSAHAAAPADAEESPKTKPPKDAPIPSPFVRVDFCEKCWSEGKRPDSLTLEAAPAGLTMFSFWKTTIPTPQQKKKLLVDDSVLVDVFTRMENRNEPQEIRFRFVLALILMRKRLLKYEGMEETPTPADAAPQPEIWTMVPRCQEAPVRVINPHLTGEQITEVSQQLSAILAEEV